MPDSDKAGFDDDSALVALVRAGDAAAFERLYKRHRAIARFIATSETDNISDVDDVVAEAMASTFQAISAGKGPDVSFRGYLLTTVRRIAYKANRARARTFQSALPSVLDRVQADQDPVMVAFEASVVGRAFMALPPRWQEVLWYVDVEGMKPKAASVLLGVTPNAVSTLARRARERLRQLYLQNHINMKASMGPDCAEHLSQLGAYVLGGLKRSSREKVHRHVETCSGCSELLLELNEVQAAMRVTIFLLMVGLGSCRQIQLWRRRRRWRR